MRGRAGARAAGAWGRAGRLTSALPGLQSAILSAQSAATVRKESLCQPALEVLETSSQESSLESDTDEDDYMDI